MGRDLTKAILRIGPCPSPFYGSDITDMARRASAHVRGGGGCIDSMVPPKLPAINATSIIYTAGSNPACRPMKARRARVTWPRQPGRLEPPVRDDDGERLGVSFQSNRPVQYRRSRRSAVLAEFPDAFKAIFVSRRNTIFLCLRGVVYRAQRRRIPEVAQLALQKLSTTIRDGLRSRLDLENTQRLYKTLGEAESISSPTGNLGIDRLPDTRKRNKPFISSVSKL